ncbi:MAG: DUF861 domain-containing protein [Alphaproteobacteria bacterium]|nr:MAG: DUF861 domain-containing protein [Alphaproteobacteria bacterium]
MRHLPGLSLASSCGEPVTIGKGDLVTFPKGMSCTCKHYRFGN